MSEREQSGTLQCGRSEFEGLLPLPFADRLMRLLAEWGVRVEVLQSATAAFLCCRCDSVRAAVQAAMAEATHWSHSLDTCSCTRTLVKEQHRNQS